MSREERFTRVQALLRHGAIMAWELPDQDLGHGLIDLARSARREILASSQGRMPTRLREGEEGALLYHVLPEISRRLIAQDGASLLRLREERTGTDMSGLPDTMLRTLTARALERSEFRMIAEIVRGRFDPDYTRTETFFATEAIGRDPRDGNILEIALSRAAPPTRQLDPLSRAISDRAERTGLEGDFLSWSPEIPSLEASVSTPPEKTRTFDDEPA